MKVTSLIYLVKDLHGNLEYASCGESCDIVQICTLKDKSGNKVYFESDAYHLHRWCKENDLELKVIEKEFDFEQLWND